MGDEVAHALLRAASALMPTLYSEALSRPDNVSRRVSTLHAKVRAPPLAGYTSASTSEICSIAHSVSALVIAYGGMK